MSENEGGAEGSGHLSRLVSGQEQHIFLPDLPSFAGWLLAGAAATCGSTAPAVDMNSQVSTAGQAVDVVESPAPVRRHPLAWHRSTPATRSTALGLLLRVARLASRARTGTRWVPAYSCTGREIYGTIVVPVPVRYLIQEISIPPRLEESYEYEC